MVDEAINITPVRYLQLLLQPDIESQWRLVYQPIYRLVTNEIVGFEGLIRWQHPEHGNIRPDLFIPEMENIPALASRLNNWVIRSACKQSKEWGCRYPLSVNIAPASIQEVGEVQLPKAITEFGCTHECIRLELTERQIIQPELLMYYSHYIQGIRQELHVGVKLDDYGIGERGLRWLDMCRFDGIKVDSCLMPRSRDDRVRSAIYNGIAVTMHDLEIEITAEGIETEEQRDLIASKGIDLGQGYYFSRPIEATAVPALVGL